VNIDELSADVINQANAMELLKFITLDDLPVKGVDEKDFEDVTFEAKIPMVMIHDNYHRDGKRTDKEIPKFKRKMVNKLTRWAKNNGILEKVDILAKPHKIPADYPTKIRINGYVITKEPVTVKVPKLDHEWWEPAMEKFTEHAFRHMKAVNDRIKNDK